MKKAIQMFRTSLGELSVVRNLVLCGLMAALAVILGMVGTISAGPYIRIGFSGLPNRMVDFLFGPAAGCLFGGMLDLLKYIVTPSGPFFFFFTFNAMLAGLIYGSILYRRPVSWKRVIFAEFLVKLLVNCTLNTLWLSMLYDNAFMILLPARMIKNAVMLPIDCIILYFSLAFMSRVVFRLWKVHN